MRAQFRIFFMVTIAILTVFYVLYYRNINFMHQSVAPYPLTEEPRLDEMSIAVVVCGNRSQETLVMLKSALLFTRKHLNFYIFCDSEVSGKLLSKLDEWDKTSNKSFSYSLQAVQFPPGEFQKEWRKLFKPCASQRLFLPGLLRDIDSVLYVDTDTLFLGPVEQVWHHFHKMNDSQLAALAPEHEDPQIGWYNRFAKHPFYKPLGVNTGVMLMNLTRMRSFGWESYISPIYLKYKTSIPWGDQDIINIIFSFHPEKLYLYSCKYNYRADHCMYTSVCKVAEREGIVVLHGSRGIFHNDQHPPFRSVYKAFEDHEWSTSISSLFATMKSYVDSSPTSQCGAVRHIFTKNLEKFIHEISVDR